MTLLTMLLPACGGGGGTGGSTPTVPAPIQTIAPVGTPIPISPISVTPSNVLNFAAAGPEYAQTIVLSESGYSGAFSFDDKCAGIVTFVAGLNGTYIVTPIAAGTCLSTVVGSPGSSAPIYVQVTTIQVVGN